jgi:hypothetical protein
MSAVRARTKKILRNIAGTIVILVGIAGLFLPFLQGIALIVAGFLMLDFERKDEIVLRVREHHWTRRLAEWLSRLRARVGHGPK